MTNWVLSFLYGRYPLHTATISLRVVRVRKSTLELLFSVSKQRLLKKSFQNLNVFDHSHEINLDLEQDFLKNNVTYMWMDYRITSEVPVEHETLKTGRDAMGRWRRTTLEGQKWRLKYLCRYNRQKCWNSTTSKIAISGTAIKV